MKESSAVEIIWNEEDKVIDPNVLISLEQSFHEEVIQSVHEKQDEIFVQVSEKSSFNNSVITDNLIAMSYEDDQQCFQISEDQGIKDCHSAFYVLKCYFMKTITV